MAARIPGVHRLTACPGLTRLPRLPRCVIGITGESASLLHLSLLSSLTQLETAFKELIAGLRCSLGCAAYRHIIL